MNDLRSFQRQTGGVFPLPNGPALVASLHNSSFSRWLSFRSVRSGGMLKAKYDAFLDQGGFQLGKTESGILYVRVASNVFNSTMRYRGDQRNDVLQIEHDRWATFIDSQEINGFFVHSAFRLVAILGSNSFLTCDAILIECLQLVEYRCRITERCNHWYLHISDFLVYCACGVDIELYRFVDGYIFHYWHYDDCVWLSCVGWVVNISVGVDLYGRCRWHGSTYV